MHYSVPVQLILFIRAIGNQRRQRRRLAVLNCQLAVFIKWILHREEKSSPWATSLDPSLWPVGPAFTEGINRMTFRNYKKACRSGNAAPTYLPSPCSTIILNGTPEGWSEGSTGS